MRNVVTRGARRATRICCGGPKNLHDLKPIVHRRNRHVSRIACAAIEQETAEDDEAVLSLDDLTLVTSWDVA